MDSDEVKGTGIEKFDGRDFGYWKMQIEDYLYGKKLHLPLLGQKPEAMKDEEWISLDRQVLGLIRLTLTRKVAHNIIKERTTAGLMAALSGMYEKPSANNKVYLMKKLFNLKMAEGMPVTQHLNNFNTITNQLSSVEIDFDDEIRALILLASLPNSWEAMRTAVSNSAGKSKLNYDDIRDLILGEEVRRRDAGESSTSGSALNVETRGRRFDKYSNRGRSKSRPRPRQDRSKSRSRKPIECWHCGKPGHIQANCYKMKEDDDKSANTVAEEGHEALLLSVSSPLDSWVLDSGASFHTTPHQNILQNYVAGDYGVVYLADGEPLRIIGVGDVEIKLPNNSTWRLQQVRHVPELKKNLISVGQLDESGHSINFSGGMWKVSKGVMILARGKKTGTLYMTPASEDIIATAEAENQADLWHYRLGHMSEKGMKLLLSKGKLPGLKSAEFDLCEGCIFGKQKKVSFLKNGRTPRSKKLELVHSDVWGPSPVASRGGLKYYVTFIDDSSRKVWVYFLKNKSDVFETFKKWKALVETETGLKLKCLRSDNGGEYTDGDLKEFCASNCIRMEKTIPGTPQQNGVVERMNRTINERARSIRLHAGLPPIFWSEAVNTAVYLINRGPSVPLNFRIPEEVWTGKEVNLSHLKVFGCISYVHIDSEARSKLDAKSRKCIFVGYGTDEFGYRFWDEENRKIIRSKNVIFNEKMTYKNKEAADSDKAETSDVIDVDDIAKSIVQGDIIDKENTEPQEEPCTPATIVRRSSRTIRPPHRFSPSLNYILLTDNGEPESLEEATRVEESSKWELAMKDEMNSLTRNQTWELTSLPKGKIALHNKWVYRIKEEHNGSKRFKARLVVKGFQQKEGIDYTDIFSPVVKMTTIRLVLSIVAAEDLHLEQLDVKTAFLHGDLEEDIYMKQPEGFSEKGKENMVCRLKRSLYGLKQAPRQWYKKFDNFMCNNGFTRLQADHCCYVKNFGSSYIILLIYVDDMLVAGSSIGEINKLKQQLSKQFEMKDLGNAKQILGMRIIRDRDKGTLKLSQEEYVKKVLHRFKMDGAKPISTPLAKHFKLTKEQSPKTEEERNYMNVVPYASAIGSLMYVMVCTRPDIAHAVGVVNRYMSNPGKQHWEAVKWIMRYLKGTSNTSLCFTKSDLKLQGYVDADLAGDIDTRKSTTGFVYTLGNTAVCWASKLQKIVALSTTEAEYVAVYRSWKGDGLVTKLLG